jgi:hypothetical protein
LRPSSGARVDQLARSRLRGRASGEPGVSTGEPRWAARLGATSPPRRCGRRSRCARACRSGAQTGRRRRLPRTRGPDGSFPCARAGRERWCAASWPFFLPRNSTSPRFTGPTLPTRGCVRSSPSPSRAHQPLPTARQLRLRLSVPLRFRRRRPGHRARAQAPRGAARSRPRARRTRGRRRARAGTLTPVTASAEAGDAPRPASGG